MNGKGQQSGQESDDTRRRERSVGEWVMFACTLAVLLAVIAAIVWLWAIDRRQPPGFEVTPRPPKEVAGAVHVPVDVHNTGSRTAAKVEVAAQRADGRRLGSQRIDFLSGNETTTVTFVLARRPAGVNFRVVGFQSP